MTDSLRQSLRTSGWRSSNRTKGFLQTWREGIEFQVGRRPGEAGLELRYFYKTARTDAEGTVSLPADATSATVEDALSAVYLRIHDNPIRRTLARGQRGGGPGRGEADAAAQMGLDFSAED